MLDLSPLVFTPKWLPVPLASLVLTERSFRQGDAAKLGTTAETKNDRLQSS